MPGKRPVFIEISSLLLISLLIAAAFLVPKKEYRRDQTIIAFGDSLTRGYGTPPGKNFVTFLSEAVNIPIINAGKSGDTTSEALIRLQEDVLNKKPDIVILFLGANDYLIGYSEEVMSANIRTIVRNIKAAGAKIILIGGSSKISPQYEAVYQKIYSEEKINGYVPNVIGTILLRKDMLFDEIHPNELGHQEIAARILPVLKKVLDGK